MSCLDYSRPITDRVAWLLGIYAVQKFNYLPAKERHSVYKLVKVLEEERAYAKTLASINVTSGPVVQISSWDSTTTSMELS